MTKLRVLFMKDGAGGDWVAQCLEYDIAAQGSGIPETMKAFEYALSCEVAFSRSRGEELFERIGPAPEYYWTVYETRGWTLARPQEQAETFSPELYNLPGFDELRVA